MVETNDEWIVERTGIRERRIAADDVSTSDLAAGALAAACENAEIELDSLDAIIVGTSTADTGFPSTACWTQHKLGISGAAAFDVAAGCTGWLYGLEVASGLLASGAAKRIGVVGAEVMSKVIDWTDRTTCVLFGDGAGATILEAAEGDAGVLASNWGANGTLAPILYQPAGGTRKPASAETVANREHTVHMEGRAVFRHAVGSMVKAAKNAMTDAEVTPEDVALLIPHQANIRIIEATRQRSKVPPERTYLTVARYGNMSAATIPVAIHEARGEGRINDGDIVVLTAFGTGLTWGASVLRF